MSTKTFDFIFIHITTLTNPTACAKFNKSSDGLTYIDWQGMAMIGLGTDKNNNFLSLLFHYNTKKNELLSGVEHNVYWLTVINGLQYRQVPSNRKLLQRVINPRWPAPAITNVSRQRILEMLVWYFWWKGNAYDNSLEKGQPSEISPHSLVARYILVRQDFQPPFVDRQS